MAMPLWVVTIIKKTFPGLFTIAKLTRVKGLGGAIEAALFKGDSLIYLPKEKAIEVGREIETGETVLPSRVVEHFIEEANFLWLMDTCICRESSSCEDYPVDLGCLFMGEAAMKINPGLGRQVSREEAKAHIAKCREAGLVHLIGRNKLDTVWLGVGPGNKLLTVCNCCPCCCLWRSIPYLRDDIADKVQKMPGVTVRVTDDCVGCGTCTENVCFVNAVRLEGDKAVIGADCKGCGRCAEACPNGAIEIEIDKSKWVDESIENIARLVDVK